MKKSKQANKGLSTVNFAPSEIPSKTEDKHLKFSDKNSENLLLVGQL